MNELKKFNRDQIQHVQTFQALLFEWVQRLVISAIEHDTSKWSDKEYDAFVAARDSLRGSKNGQDAEYQKNYQSEAIQHHVKNNPHHPEYWDARNEPMPLHEIIAMFFDWYSRCQQKNTSLDAFWQYNLAKLTNQIHAIPVVESLRRYVDDNGISRP